MAAGHCSLTSVSNSVPSRRRCTQHTPSSIRHLLCHNVTAPLLLLCWRNHRTGKALGEATALHPTVRRALRLLSEGDGPASLTDLAKACGASEAYLSRTFRRQIGVPLTRYRNSLRLSRFWEHYRQPAQKTLAEAVYAAGFGSYAQFYKVFTEAYGRGPRACLHQVAESGSAIVV